jgi:hypothetical protein
LKTRLSLVLSAYNAWVNTHYRERRGFCNFAYDLSAGSPVPELPTGHSIVRDHFVREKDEVVRFLGAYLGAASFLFDPAAAPPPGKTADDGGDQGHQGNNGQPRNSRYRRASSAHNAPMKQLSDKSNITLINAPECRQDHHVHFGMAEEPEQMLKQERIASA